MNIVEIFIVFGTAMNFTHPTPTTNGFFLNSPGRSGWRASFKPGQHKIAHTQKIFLLVGEQWLDTSEVHVQEGQQIESYVLLTS